MKVTVRIGSRLLKLTEGAPHLTLELAGGATVREAIQLLVVKQPALAEALSKAVFVVNGRLVERDHGLADGHVLGVLEAVAGGSGHAPMPTN